MTPGDRVAQLYPQALGTQFSRLLRHAWVTVELLFNPRHHTGSTVNYIAKNQLQLQIQWCIPYTVVAVLPHYELKD
jgi:hypothetical protein